MRTPNISSQQKRAEYVYCSYHFKLNYIYSYTDNVLMENIFNKLTWMYVFFLMNGAAQILLSLNQKYFKDLKMLRIL